MRSRSPFRGMDLYLERHWLDVHARLNYLASESLQPQLGGVLFARTEERVFVEEPEYARPRSIGPDVRIVEVEPDGGGSVATMANPATQPIVFEVDDEPIHQRYIEIRDASSGGRLVTVIEFVSPSNKHRGEGRKLYRQKQQECRRARVNLVEIDLTRDGRRQLFVSQWSGSDWHRTVYAASIWRATQRRKCGLVPIRLQDRLPTIAIPLRAGDVDATLDLQALIDRAYESGAYGRTIDYSKPPEPPLLPDDAAWAAELLASPAAAG